MKKMMTFMCAMSLAIAGFAQVTGSLTPAGGNFYPGDETYQSKIDVVYTDTIDATNVSAVITAGSTTYTLTPVNAFAAGFSLEVPTLADGAFTLAVSGVTDDAGVAVADLTGTYNYKSVFPLTSITPAKGSTLTSKTATVVFTFNQNITSASIVVTSGSVTTTLPGVALAANSATVTLEESYWGTPSGGYNNINIALKDAKDANGTLISNAPGSLGTIMSYYTIADAPATVTFLGTDPAADGWTYAEDLMGWEIAFKYSDTVVMGNAAATAVISYLNATGIDVAEPVEVPAANITGMYNPRGGYYGLFIPIPAAPAYEGTFAKMTITVQGLTYNGSAVANQTVSFDAAPANTFRAPATRGENGGGTTGIQSEKANVDPMVNIYSAQGILIKKNVPASTVNALGRGLYIVGNEKVFVK